MAFPKIESKNIFGKLCLFKLLSGGGGLKFQDRATAKINKPKLGSPPRQRDRGGTKSFFAKRSLFLRKVMTIQNVAVVQHRNFRKS